MRPVRRRPLLLCAAALLAFVLIGLGVAVAQSPARAPAHSRTALTARMSVRKARALSRATSSRVIVILRNQYFAIPATKTPDRAARCSAERLGNARIVTQVQRSGGRVYRTYHALNAFAATVSSNERAALQQDAAVAQVMPDTIVQLPAPINALGRDRPRLRARAPPRPAGRPSARATRASRCSSPRRCRPRTPRSTTRPRPRRRTWPTARASRWRSSPTASTSTTPTSSAPTART